MNHEETVTLLPSRLIAVLAAAGLLLTGCASQKGEPNTQFDFGPAVPPAAAQAAQPAQDPLAAIVVTDVTGSSALDNERMFYRLSYADALQARSYANSRWTANPLQMMTQRLKTRIAQSGTKVLSETDASLGIPLLRVDVDDFIHDFSGVSRSQGVVAVRASVFRGHTLVDQKTFTRATAAATADAATGAPIVRVQVDEFVHAFSSASESQGIVVVRASLMNGHALVDQKTFSRSTPAPSADASGGARALAASTDAIAADITGWLGTLNLQQPR